MFERNQENINPFMKFYKKATISSFSMKKMFGFENSGFLSLGGAPLILCFVKKSSKRKDIPVQSHPVDLTPRVEKLQCIHKHRDFESPPFSKTHRVKEGGNPFGALKRFLKSYTPVILCVFLGLEPLTGVGDAHCQGKEPQIPLSPPSQLQKKELEKLYKLLGRDVLWIKDDQWNERTQNLLKTFKNSYEEGLNPQAYLPRLEVLLKQSPSSFPNPKVADYAITSLLLIYAQDLFKGRLRHLKEVSSTLGTPDPFDVVSYLVSRLKSDENGSFLPRMTVPLKGYQRLKKLLASYETSAGEKPWPVLKDGPPLKPSSKSSKAFLDQAHKERLATLKTLLALQENGISLQNAQDDLTEPSENSENSEKPQEAQKQEKDTTQDQKEEKPEIETETEIQRGTSTENEVEIENTPANPKSIKTPDPIEKTEQHTDSTDSLDAPLAKIPSKAIKDSNDPEEEDHDTPELWNAVKRFQNRHGLEVDGVVGPQTLSMLNTSHDDQKDRIILAMERWRWLPKNLGHRYIIVNIPHFQLTAYEKDKKVLEMKIIVGRQYRKTPTFFSEVYEIRFNPAWHVPQGIFRKDKLPKILEDPSYVTRKGFKVYDAFTGTPRDPYSVDWEQDDIRLVQPPGNQNALGKIRFTLKTTNDVYLHGTPDHQLFNKTQRAFSSGCIRVEDPVKLATYMFNDDDAWSSEKISQETSKTTTRNVPLKSAVPLYVLYMTVWVDDKGTPYFLNDLYGRDRALIRDLKKNRNAEPLLLPEKS